MLLTSTQPKRHVVDESFRTSHHAATTEIHSIAHSNPTIAYPKWIGRKFKTDGSIIPFAGNTILSHIDKESQLFSILSEIHQKLSQCEYAQSFALLPPSTYHVTLMEGVSDAVRESSRWPRDLPVTTELSSCNFRFLEKLSSTRISLENPIRMRNDGWRPLENGVSLRLIPATASDKKQLSSFRDTLADTLQLRHPGHESYDFHISITYSLRFFNEAEHQEITQILAELEAKLPKYIEIGAPELCTFKDMFKFEALYSLGS